MEWVETTGDTIEEAKSAALDQLGVAEDDAEFEVLEEPKQGLFGRTRGEARVRARVRPTSPRAKADRRDRGPKREKRQGESKRGPRKERSTERAPRAEREPKTNTTPIDPTTVSAAATTFLRDYSLRAIFAARCRQRCPVRTSTSMLMATACRCT